MKRSVSPSRPLSENINLGVRGELAWHINKPDLVHKTYSQHIEIIRVGVITT